VAAALDFKEQLVVRTIWDALYVSTKVKIHEIANLKPHLSVAEGDGTEAFRSYFATLVAAEPGDVALCTLVGGVLTTGERWVADDVRPRSALAVACIAAIASGATRVRWVAVLTLLRLYNFVPARWRIEHALRVRTVAKDGAVSRRSITALDGASI
jgi:hypothetical protein